MPEALNPTRRRYCTAALAAMVVPGAGSSLLPREASARTGASTAEETAALPPPSASLPTRLRFTFSRRLADPRTQWLIAVYRQLLAGMGIGFEFVDVPAGRATLMIESGEIDGELGRTYGYGALYPWLVRVPEPNNRVEFAVFSLDPSLQGAWPGWPAIRDRELHCEYRRGIQEIAALLAEELPPQQASAVTTVEQGIRRLQLQRTDLYFDVREAVEDFFEFGFASQEAMNAPRPQMLAVLKATTGHAYLHQRHQALVPQISRGLAEMKRQGIVSRLREETRQAFLATAKGAPAASRPATSPPGGTDPGASHPR